MDTSNRNNIRLDSWKAVAAYFGRDERTVRRWEAERGLPIRRLPGGGRSRIFAEIEELEAWRRGGGADEAALPSPTAEKPSRPWLLALLILMNVISASGVGYLWFQRAPRPAPSPPPLAAQALFVQGSQAWALRTPSSLNEALDDFNGAVRIDADYAEAWVGLAKTFDVLPDSGPTSSGKAYEQARAAAKKALALDDRLAEGHAALAVADYWGFEDSASARRELDRAVALDPKAAFVREARARFEAAQGDFRSALNEVALAHSLDPSSRSAIAEQGEILAQAGRTAEAVGVLQAAEAAFPDFRAPHAYLEGLYLIHGPEADYLRECEAVARVAMDAAHQAECAAARRGLESGGRAGMLGALLEVRLGRARIGRTTASSVAAIYNLLGRKDQALEWLRRSHARREPDLYGLGNDPRFRNLQNDPDFQAILRSEHSS
jgi:tetratricopeptide (TPR) repeat protein